MTEAEKRQQIISAVTGWLRILVAPDQVTELRALHVRRRGERTHTESGFFDFEHLEQMTASAVDVSASARGVYFTLNPLRPSILARRANRTDWAGEGELAKDTDVIARRWFLLDADPVRDPLVSSTDPEKAAALQTVQALRADLSGRGWPAPVLGDSGNGFHLLYRVDLPADDGGLVQRLLRALAAEYDTPAVKIDQKVFNPARICKVPGTLARKGDSVADRPHRRARLLEVP
jgi:hypothetical protein